jgi:rRNA-processing protein EBP2
MAKKNVSKKSDLKPSRGRTIQLVETIEPALSNDESESDSSETVDDEGMEKLMKALGEDGLNEFDLEQLHTLTGTAAGDEEGEEDEGSSDETEDGEQGGEEEEGSNSSGEDIALDDEDVDSVDEDAVPRRKIAIDNTVRHSLSFTRYFN